MSLAALKRPFGFRALLGILIAWIPIVEFFAMGYKMACARTAMSGSYELPFWRREWKQLFVFGLGARVLQILYLLPAALAMYSLWLLSKSPIAVLITFVGTVRNLLIAFFVLLVIASYFCPASILNYVAEGRFRAAFSLQMLKRTFSLAYLKGWALAAMYSVVIAGLFFVLIYAVGATASITLAYLLMPVMLILFFLPGVTIWTLLGEAWGKSIARE
jgi:hypothetical protein